MVGADRRGDAAAAAACRVLAGAGLSFEKIEIAPSWTPGAPGPRGRARFTEADRSAVAASDAVFLVADPDEESLAWLFRPLDLTIRFRRCRGEAGDIVLFGDGGFDPPLPRARQAVLEAAFQYALKHGRRRVTLALHGTADSEEAGFLARSARELSKGASGVSYGESPAERLAAAISAAADARRPRSAVAPTPPPPRPPSAIADLDVVVCVGDAWAALAEPIAGLFGGGRLVPSARFGAESAVLECGLAGSPAPPAGRPTSVPRCGSPIAAIRASALLCEWLGETGRAARISAAVESVAGSAEGGGRGEVARDDAECAMDTAEAVVRRL